MHFCELNDTILTIVREKMVTVPSAAYSVNTTSSRNRGPDEGSRRNTSGSNVRSRATEDCRLLM